MTIEILDRRGSNKVVEVPKPEAKTESVVSTDRNGWKPDSTGYMFQPQKIDGQLVFAGTAFGIRTDGNPFFASFLLTQVVAEGFRWEPKARKRLDTYLGCECSPHSPCMKHKALVPQWVNEDRERLAIAAVQEVPEAIEIAVRAQRAKEASQIAVPGR